MPGFSAEQAEAVVHAALMLLRGQLPVLAQFPSQVQVWFWVLWGLALGCSLRIPSSFWVALRVDLTCWVSLMHNFSPPLPVAVLDGLYELMEVQQGDGPVVVHHLIFDVAG